MQLFLDCDGVLADFDRAATKILGLRPKEFQHRYGLGRFWGKLARTPHFYATLPLMPDAMELFDAVRHLDPIILTGCPRGGWAEAQKETWVARHFPGTRVITTMAARKREHCTPGDILVDDTLKYRDLWEGAGGTFVHHKSAAGTLAELRRMKVLTGAARGASEARAATAPGSR
ncbi:MAG: hypothetical protein AB7E79_01450 [Rhodospirillaceae bacterium]